MNKESIKQFIKLDGRKFIIPVILVGLFFYTLFFFYYIGGVADKILCEYTSLIREIDQESYESKNEAYARLEELGDEFLDFSLSFQRGKKTMELMMEIDPFMPAPCELLFPHTKYNFQQCSFFMKKDTYDCIMKEWTNPYWKNEEIDDRLRKYNTVSPAQILVNILYLLLAGYLLSCLIVSVWDRIKK